MRYIGNRSTGKMGVAIAEAALARGARVTLIRGMTTVALPDAANWSARPARPRCATRCLPRCRVPTRWSWPPPSPTSAPSTRLESKIARTEAGLTLELEPTADILAEAARRAREESTGSQRPVIVGFAAETGSLERAREKADRKGVDLLVGQRRRRGRVGLRHGHQPGHHRRAGRAGPKRGR